ncbi:alpha/beta fold hydrolase [Opitutus sp. ER46]|uniref:alpha/beta fold hydrolase n=1 Tax=Opitutus sp. ER46 TaxID=2161864 RepID=UPI001E3B9EBF|nr:alpha/beta fold hydrolase [Opitutus sp. ER46]
MHLFHRELGGAGNPPLILLHGMLGSSRNWQTTGADLAQRYHVFALDLRNHGKSPHGDEMTYEAMVADVLAWMDEHLVPAASLLGHSMGGKVAMLLACRHPARVTRLLVVDIAPKDYTWVGHRAEFAAMNELNLGDLRSRAEAELRFEARVPSWPMRKFLATNLDRDAEGRWRWQINLPVLTTSLPTLESNVLTPADRFEGPTRFLLGGASRYVEPADHAAIRQHFPGAEIVTLPGAGHNPHMDARTEFVRAALA